VTKRSFTDERERKIVDQYQSGVPTCDLVHQYGVSDTTIRNVLRRHGVTLCNRNVDISEDEEREMIGLYESGLCTREVAEHTGVVKSTVLKVLCRNGINRRPIHQYKLSEEKRLEVAMSYADGISLRTLAKGCDISVTTVHECLKEFGVPSRTGWGRYKTKPWTDCCGRELVFKSQWELSYAKYLDDNGFEWEYEPHKFILDGYSYTPDFSVVTGKGIEYHEVKGWLDDRTVSRILAFARKYSDLKLKIIGPAEMVRMGLVESYYENHPMAQKVSGLISHLDT